MTASGRLGRLDARACRFARSLPHREPADKALAALSRATDHAAAWLVLGALGALADRPRRRAWLTAALTVASAEHASTILKRATARPRPDLAGLPPLAPTPSPLSLPSSHTACAVAAAMTFGELLPPAGLWGLAALTAASRPYLGVHYPSDVLAGAALGCAVGRLGRRALRAGAVSRPPARDPAAPR